MKLLNSVLIGLSAAVIGGCAGTPKQELSITDYTEIAQYWFVTDYCNAQGWLSPDVAASGKLILRRRMSNYMVDPVRFNQELTGSSVAGIKPTREYCNTLSMVIHEQNQRIAEYNQDVRDNQRAAQERRNSTQMQSTYCTRIGFQTFCNTY